MPGGRARTASVTIATAASTSTPCSAGARTLATEPTQMTATQRASRRAKGPWRAAARGGDAPSMRQESAAATSTSGTIVQNAARQTPRAAKNPPTAGPVMAAAPHAAEITASRRGQRCSGNSARTAPYAPPIKRPEPSPWTARPATITGMLHAEAQMIVPLAKIAEATSTPTRAPTLPTSTERLALPMIDVTAYAVEPQA